MDPNVGYVVAGYTVTVVALGGYALRLFVRARRARERADAISHSGPSRRVQRPL
jgi:hypothetical protein